MNGIGLKREGPLAPREAAEIARQVANGLAAAHARGLVHRDVKPGNVLLEQRAASSTSEAPHVKLTDFGLARAVDDVSITRSGFLAGTPQYMSPEQADSLPVDHRSDLFSLGGLLYVMLTGKPPFGSASTAATLRRIVDREPEPAANRNAPDAAGLWPIIDKLLAKRPEQRFASALQVAAALAAFLDHAADGSALAKYARMTKRRMQPLPVALFVVSVLVAAVWGLNFGSNAGRSTSSDNAASATTATSASNSTGNNSDTVTELDPNAAAPVVPQIANAARHRIVSDDFEWASAENVGPGINSKANEDHACISADGLTLIFTHGVDREIDLWSSQRANINEPFPAAAPLPNGINSKQFDSSAFLTNDGLSLWFASSRIGGLGGFDIYLAQRPTVADQFAAPTLVAAPINSAQDESSPCLSADGLSLYFARGKSLRKLFVATRSAIDAPFDTPRELQSLNIAHWHEFPLVLSDNLTLLCVISQAENFQHLFVATRSTLQSEFGGLTNLGPTINDQFGAISGPSWSEAESALYFSSKRPGGEGNRDLWRVRRIKKSAKTELPLAPTDPAAPAFAVAPFSTAEAQQHQVAWAEHLKVKPEVENSIGMTLKLIPPGEFFMGASADDPEAQPQERPQHRVRLTRPFFMSATEVTLGAFRKFVEAEKHVTSAESDGQGAFEINPRIRRQNVVWNKQPSANTDEFPVRCVDWDDAIKFCDWLSRTEDAVYRLPTEAEWEFACRAGTVTRYCFGNEFDLKQANSAIANPDRVAGVQPVASYQPNAFGLFDMHGNLNEICWDSGRVFSSELSIDPIGSLDRNSPAVVRGGATSSSPARLRSSQRYVTDGRIAPEINFATPVKGFRVICEVK